MYLSLWGWMTGFNEEMVKFFESSQSHAELTLVTASRTLPWRSSKAILTGCDDLSVSRWLGDGSTHVLLPTNSSHSSSSGLGSSNIPDLHHEIPFNPIVHLTYSSIPLYQQFSEYSIPHQHQFHLPHIILILMYISTSHTVIIITVTLRTIFHAISVNNNHTFSL